MRKNYFLIAIFMASIVSIIWLFQDILKIAFISWLLVMITQPIAAYIETGISKSRIKTLITHKEFFSATLLTFIMLLALFIPIGYLVSYLITHLDYTLIYKNLINIKSNTISYINSTHIISNNIKSKILSYINEYSKDFATSSNLKQIWIIIQKYIANISKLVLDISMIITFFFLFHWYYKEIIQFFFKITPIPNNKQTKIYNNVSGIIGIVFHTTLAVAISQGIAFGLLMTIFDYNAPMLGLLTAITSIIPIVGSALVWVPVVIIEIIKGNLVNAITITIFGSFVLAFLIDNFVRLFFLNKISKVVIVDYKINEFLLFFAMASGITVFGFWGILIGPTIVAVFITLSHELYNE